MSDDEERAQHLADKDEDSERDEDDAEVHSDKSAMIRQNAEEEDSGEEEEEEEGDDEKGTENVEPEDQEEDDGNENDDEDEVEDRHTAILNANSDDEEENEEKDKKGKEEQAKKEVEAEPENNEDEGSEEEDEESKKDEDPNDPIEQKPVLTKSEIFDHFIKKFNLPLHPNGEPQDDKVSSLLKVITQLLTGHALPVLPICASFIKENMDSDSTSNDGGICDAMSDFLARFTDSDDTIDWAKYSTEDCDRESATAASTFLIGTLLTEIFAHIREHFGENGAADELLKLLGYLALLDGRQKFDLKLCFYVFYHRVMRTKDDELAEMDLDELLESQLENLAKGGEKNVCEAETGDAATEDVGKEKNEEEKSEKDKEIERDVEDLKKIKSYLTTLERYSLVNLDKIEEAGGNDDVQAVEITKIVQTGVRNQQKEGEDWALVFDLVDLFRQRSNLSTEYEQHILSVHGALEEFEYPKKSYRHSIYFATAFHAWLRSQDEAKRVLKDVYNFFMSMKSTEKEERKDKEYFNLTKMALVLLQNEENEEFRQQGALHAQMDNSGIFHEADYLNKITGLEFFAWVLSQACEFMENEFVQHFAAQLLVIPVCVHEGALDDAKKKQMIGWIGDYRKKIGEKPKTDRIFGLLETPLTIIKLAAHVQPSVRVMKMAMEMVKPFTETEGVTKCSWFIQEAFYLMKPSPICSWESEHSIGELIEMRGVAKVLVDQGLGLFIEMLTELEKLYSKDYYLDLHFLDFLETMKACSFYEECVKVLLKSTEFFEKLKDIFHSIIDAIEKNEDVENIKAVCHILVFWYALVTNSDNKKKQGYENLIPEEMEMFFAKIEDEESPVAIAFDAEKHWHIYFREQGDTGEKILKKFMDTYDESSGDVYQLAKRLKDTISRKEGWWLVSHSVRGAGDRSLAEQIADD